jgi:hypothetical protein
MRLAAKLGFTEVERFEKYGAEQWFGAWPAPNDDGTVGSPTGFRQEKALAH